MSQISYLRRVVSASMLIALCVVLPMAFHAIPRAGSVILPMHIPVLLAGLVTGPFFGLITGLVGPLLAHLLTGMPPSGMMQSMMIELGMYGFVSGMAIKMIRTKSASLDLYISLILAMLVGRVAAGLAQAVFFFGGTYVDGVWNASYTWALWISSFFVTSLPGLIIQLAFIPSVVMALERERIIPFRYPVKA